MIYLDNNATTCVDPDVLALYTQLLSSPLANPGSLHRYGQMARHQLICSKKSIADTLGVSAQQVILTSGATEGINMLLSQVSGGIITSSLEHAAVNEALQSARGPVTRLNPLPGQGAILPEQVAAAINEQTRMLVFMAANNETGICTDMEAMAELAYQRDLLLVIDAVAYLGKAPWQMPKGRVAVVMSGHKLHAPVGIGAVVSSKSYPLKPFILGGGQQRGLRGGTEMVALSSALACALEKITPESIAYVHKLRQTFEEGIEHLNPIIQGQDQKRVSNVTNVAFPHTNGETLLTKLDLEGVAASHGSACQSGALELSHVLINMGLDKALVRGAIRFSFSRFNTFEEIDALILILNRLLAGQSHAGSLAASCC